MKRGATLVLIFCFILAGCADKETINRYYDVEAQRTQAIIDSINQQSADIQQSNLQAMRAFSSAASSAAATESQTDDVVIAFAFGHFLGKPNDLEVPRLPPIAEPDQNSDLWRAATPVLGLLVPFIYPLAYGWAAGNGGSSYTATDNAKINIRSENSGSGNTAGGNMTLTNTDSRTQQEADCIGCDTPDQITPDPPTIPEGGLDECFTNPPAGYTELGTPLIAPGCSCKSRSLGEC